MIKHRRLLWKIIPPYILITIVVLIGIGWYSTTALSRLFTRETEQDLEIRTRLAIQALPPIINFSNTTDLSGQIRRIAELTRTRVTLVALDGTVLGDSHENPAVMDNHADRPEIIAALKTGVGSSSRYSFTRQRDMLYVARPIPHENGQTLAILRLSLPLDNLANALASTRSGLIIGGIIFSVIFIALSIFMWSRIGLILQRMMLAARQFANGDLSHRVWVSDSREFGGLAEALNLMAGQLDARIKEIERQHNEQQAVLASMSEGVIALNTKSEVLSVNDTAGRIFSINPGQVVGQPLESVLRNAQLQDFCQRVFKSERETEQELIILEQDRHLQVHGTTLKDASRNDIGALIVLNDISHLKKLETMRQDFVANVSHELKTPITGIKGFIETLKSGALNDPENSERFLDIISDQADRLNAIIDDLLTLSRIEREQDRHRLDMQPETLRPVLEAAIADCHYQAETAQVEIELICTPELTATINADLIRQAVLNLLDNAVKYGVAGKRIQVRAEKSPETLTISVKDFGPGIPEEHHARLFERFYRVDKGRSRKLGGTGLGLAIVKHIALAHRGSVSVDSRPDAGSQFFIKIPL